MARSNQRRKFLNIVIIVCLVGIAVGMAPTLKHRLESGRWGSVAEAEPLTRPGDDPAPPATAQDAARRLEQATVVRDELAARERLIAARENVLHREVLREFWRRQAAASAATMGLVLIVVLVLVRRVGDWSGFTKRLAAEESRMRNLQLSVIGALEEFESEVAAARAWAAAEARMRRPVGDGERALSATPPTQDPSRESPFGDDFFARQPAAARIIQPDTSEASEEAAPELWKVTQRAAQTAREGIDPVAQGAAPETPGYPCEDVLGPPRPMRREEDQAATSGPGKPGEEESVWTQAIRETQGQGVPAAPEPVAPRAAPPAGPAEDAWMHRFLDPETEGAPAPDESRAAVPTDGPWGEPVLRSGPPPAPEQAPPSAQDGPRLREQIEYLAAEGFSEREIARRLSLAREEVNLALSLGRSRGMPPAPAAQRPRIASETGPLNEWSNAEWNSGRAAG